MKKGFTLIELLVSLSVVAILSTIGLAAYVEYSRQAALETAAASLKSALYDARSRALSQKKPEVCNGSFQGYQVLVRTGDFIIQGKCEFSIDDVTDYESFGNQIESTGSNITVFFPALTGTADAEYTITLESFGKTKVISVDESGTIR